METKEKAKEIYEYLRGYIFEGIEVKEKHKKEYIKEICWIIDND